MTILAKHAEDAGAELRVRDERAWVIVVGSVDAARAQAVAALVDELSRHRWLRRVSVDLTCTVATGPVAAATLGVLRTSAMPWVDVAASGAVARLVPRHLRAGDPTAA